MNIAVCGVEINWMTLFLPLKHHFEGLGHSVIFVQPDDISSLELERQQTHYYSCYGRKPVQHNNDCEMSLAYDIELSRRIYPKILFSYRKKYILQFGAALVEHYHHIFESRQINLVLVWGGLSRLTSIAAAVAKERNIPCVFIEKGYFPKTLQVDNEGVNCRNSIRKNIVQFRNIVKQKTLGEFQHKLQQPWNLSQEPDRFTKKEKIKFLYKHYDLGQFFRILIDRLVVAAQLHQRKNQNKLSINDPGKKTDEDELVQEQYIFIPAQVSLDSQILLYGGWIKSIEQFFRIAITNIREIYPSIKIIIKPHPSEFLRVDYESILQQTHNIVISHKHGTIDLVKHALCIVTINSTVGFEAILFDKPVIVLGETLYAIQELFQVTNSEEELRNALQSVQNYVAKPNEILQFASWFEQHFVSCNYAAPTVEEISRLAVQCLRYS